MTKVRDRDQVIDAAAKVFAEKGYEAARLEDIATELGILKGSIYYYTTGKIELLYLVQRRRLEALIEQADAIAGSAASPAEKLATIIRMHLQNFDDFYPESMQWLAQAARTRENGRHADDGRNLSRQYEAIIRGVIEQAIEGHEFSADVDPKIAALGLLGMCNYITRWYHKEGRLCMQEIAGNYVRIALDGLRVR